MIDLEFPTNWLRWQSQLIDNLYAERRQLLATIAHLEQQLYPLPEHHGNAYGGPDSA